MDECTNAVNGKRYLDQHLREVIQWVEQKTSIELGAIGIGHDVGQYYRRALTIDHADELATAIAQQLEKLFRVPSGHAAGKVDRAIAR